MATPRKTTTAKPKAAVKKTPARPRKTAKTIRNLRGCPVHFRLQREDQEKPFRVQLNPRGQSGDTAVIPVGLVDNDTFLKGVDTLYEIITASEAKNLTYQSVGYLGRSDAAQIVRDEDTTILTAKDWDGKGRRAPEDREIEHDPRVPRRAPEVGTGMHTVDVPGSDTGLHAALAEGNKALPPEAAFDRSNVVIERVKGQ